LSITQGLKSPWVGGSEIGDAASSRLKWGRNANNMTVEGKNTDALSTY